MSAGGRAGWLAGWLAGWRAGGLPGGTSLEAVLLLNNLLLPNTMYFAHERLNYFTTLLFSLSIPNLLHDGHITFTSVVVVEFNTNVLNNKKCNVQTEQLMSTFDGRKFFVQSAGTITLYRNIQFRQEVDARFTCQTEPVLSQFDYVRTQFFFIFCAVVTRSKAVLTPSYYVLKRDDRMKIMSRLKVLNTSPVQPRSRASTKFEDSS
ncbi:hypothetical protein DPMN_133601 [Dreissena polymorpha]|uniref:Uncharacterized protein n=1 Tax=Dreissena polymorpha TaxID=45954 RepID=A0A9D4FY78_DREPO|nr:hypothetical protein DPMN_133601 [Dreissena polymorpha]